MFKRIALITPLAILATIILSVYIATKWILYSPSGLDLSVKLARKYVPGKFTLEKATGTLGEQFSLTNVEYKYKKYEFSAKKVHLDWSAIDLLNNEVNINKLDITDAKFFAPSINHITIKHAYANVKNNKIDGHWQLTLENVAHIIEVIDGKLISEGHLTGNLKTKRYTVTGKQLLTSSKQDLSITAEPHLNIDASKLTTRVTGDVLIPKARIDTPSFTDIITLPKDVSYVDAKTKTIPQPKYSLDINVILGKDIQLNYSGLSGKLAGKLRIKEKPDAPMTAIGAVKIVDGTYSIKGKKIDIDRGSLKYNGQPINNPTIDLVASKSVDTTDANLLESQVASRRVGVRVNGNIKNPKIILFSEPAGMNQADILSYLIFDQPASSALSGSTLAVNKRLSKKLSIHYSFGIDALSKLQLMYRLNHKLRIQTTASTEGTGVDLLYVKDK